MFSVRRPVLTKPNHPQRTLSPKTIYSLYGIPEELLKNRLVTISKIAPHAMQSGTQHAGSWKIEFERSERWQYPLMGWTGSADPVVSLNLQFEKLEDALQHAKQYGWKYRVEREERPYTQPAKSYSDNFAYKPPKNDDNIL